MHPRNERFDEFMDYMIILPDYGHVVQYFFTH